jgi:heat-inducible transcriptional repressor
LIEKTHSSSGRVPTDKGWRYYVEYLMGTDFINDNENLDPKTYELVDRVFANAIVERDDAIEKACNLLADITNYTSVALGPDSSKNRVSKIELVTLSINKYLMVVITDSGHVEQDK